MKLTFDKYSQHYYLTSEVSGAVIATLTFEQLESLGQSVQEHISDAYSAEFDFLDDGDCDGCKI